jgi:hypothetical protein
MKNILKKSDINESETRYKFSSNFIFDQIIKQKIFEIEKLSKIRPETAKKTQKDNA